MKRRQSIKISIKSLAYVGMTGMISSISSGCIDREISVNSYELKLFTNAQKEMLEILAGIYLPPSDTPGANQINIVPTIEQHIMAFLPQKNQQSIIKGLDLINKLSDQLFQKLFLECDKSQQDKVVKYLSEDASKAAKKSTHLFFIFRGLVITAYFQSPTIRKEVLRYDSIPTNYNGCIDVTPSDLDWSLTGRS